MWVMVLIGLAGPGAASRAHALDTAAMINAMGPRHLSALTYIPERGTVLGRAVERGEFQLLTAREACDELSRLTRSEQVQVIGSKFVLYRQHYDKSKRKIELLRDKPGKKPKDD